MDGEQKREVVTVKHGADFAPQVNGVTLFVLHGPKYGRLHFCITLPPGAVKRFVKHDQHLKARTA